MNQLLLPKFWLDKPKFKEGVERVTNPSFQPKQGYLFIKHQSQAKLRKLHRQGRRC